jgi:hypothetical protein
MPIQVTYPGVYVQEIPGGQPAVSGVSTASTAFVDFFARGPMNQPRRVASMQDVERMFGGLHKLSEASYGLRQYFLNGGMEAWIVRTGDGTARKSAIKIEIKTPGLQARVNASLEDFAASKKAAEAALKAAQKANEYLQNMQVDGITDQELEQGKRNLRGSTDDAAIATRQAAEATRQAAAQARAASDELAMAIAKMAAASGPVADRTAMAAQKSADGAGASSDAAEATSDIAGVALRASEVARAALRIGAAARTASTAATDLQNVLDAIDASDKAAAGALKDSDAAAQQENLGLVQQGTTRAVLQAQEAAAQAQTAAENAAAAAQTVLDSLKAQKADAAQITTAQTAVDDSKAIIELAKANVKEVGEADWDAQTATDLDTSRAAAKRASDAAAVAQGLAGAGTPAAKNSKAVVVALLPTVLQMASTAALDAAQIAGKDAVADKPEPVGSLVSDTIKAINKSIDAARRSSQAAIAGSADAKVAADSVTSGGPALAARAAENAAATAQKDTVTQIQQANAVKLQVNSASMAALASSAPAKAAGDAAAKAPAEPADGVKLAFDTGQKALNAADNTVATAHSVEKAAVAVSSVSVQASKSADVAAQAAQAAVYANEEAGQSPTLTIEAINEGIWGDNLEVTLTVQGTLFSLGVRELILQNGVIRQLNGETYSNLTLDEGVDGAQQVLPLVNHNSNLVRLSQFGPKILGAYPSEVLGKYLGGGNDGGLANADQLASAMYTLDGIEPAVFNLLCLPAMGNMNDAQASVVFNAAAEYCRKKRAFFIVDIQEKVNTVDAMLKWVDSGHGGAMSYTSAVYFPRLVIPDPLNDFRPRNVGPSGTMAGIYARTDTARGVWKAPAGVDAVLMGADVSVKLNDDLNGLLNPRGVNVLRSFPIYGNIAWGARTLAGADALSSEYKYINVRRLMNYIEESVFRSLKWAVFEPNNEALWGKIRLQINGFLGSLFAAGAFQGPTPAASYFVQCDGKTTTPLDIDLGVVNVLIGIAPVKPAEFIVLSFQQIAGKAA